ncbi:PAS domain S-box protein [Cohnella caldifontis]|uniref:sensor histidine kinase n=1 Tax=Cohnella caldifontis TaxID=3027471 RepID=UPI0023EC7EE8|nr:PAS domain S-box protein [Cohnella sp. YIM B05605]
MAGNRAPNGASSIKEEVYRIVAENTSDVIVLVGSDGLVRYVSPSITNITGISVEEYMGMDAFDVIAPEDRERVRASFLQVIQQKRALDVNYRVLHVDGRPLYADTRVKPVLDESGEAVYVVAVVRDVTARKQTEELLENILDNVNAAVWSIDKDFTRYNYFSASFERMAGIPKEEFMDRPIRLHDHIHPEDNVALMGDVKDKLDRGLPVRQEFRWTHLPEETRWGQMTIMPHLNAAGDVERLDGMILDITEKKRSELALEESEQRYKSLFMHNLDGVFSIEMNGLYFVDANRAFVDITGIEPDKLKNRCFIGMIFDEDHASVYETLHEVMQHGEPRDLECRLADWDRGERIVSITFVPIILSGELTGIHGILKDITKRKQEERDLIRSEERTKFLQASLNRLSNDLAGVMKVSELESRLLEEVRAVLPDAGVSIDEAPDVGETPDPPPGTIRVRIGEKPHPVFLSITAAHPLHKSEEEWLATAVRYVTILYDNLHRTEDLMKRLEDLVAADETPTWMLRLLFRLSEKERASLSSDLHDSVLQDLIIWYRKLESLRSAGSFDERNRAALGQIEEGLLDSIHQIRITCNELRPPFLLKMGLVESLKSLFSYARMFANYEIEFSSDQLDVALNEDQILGMYRIVQELLNNANKHSKADKVSMALTDDGSFVHFRYSDDGVGTNLSGLEGSYQHMGITGIEKRVQSLEGQAVFRSAPGQGFHVAVRIPKQTTER